MSTTAVPLRPVGKSGIIILVLGLLLLMGGAAAWALTLSGMAEIRLETVRAGTGVFPTDDDVVLIKYEGKLADGTVFDANEQAPFPVGAVIPGFSQGLKRMQVGGKYVLSIPAELGYGAEAAGSIPPNSDLTFEVEVLDMRSQAEIQAMQQQQQAMQQMMQQQGGAAGGVPGAVPGGQ
jgi:FKBP-type peptidyl-prolyl cis-trans isomerase FkpA